MIGSSWIGVQDKYPPKDTVVNVMSFCGVALAHITTAKLKMSKNGVPMWSYRGRHLSYNTFTHWSPREQEAVAALRKAA